MIVVFFQKYGIELIILIFLVVLTMHFYNTNKRIKDYIKTKVSSDTLLQARLKDYSLIELLKDIDDISNPKNNEIVEYIKSNITTNEGILRLNLILENNNYVNYKIN